MLIWSQLESILSRSGKAALVTVVATRGSSPREAGARMIVAPDGTFTGTIGGGMLEWQAIAKSRSYLADPEATGAAVRGFALGPELGQCCGGHVDLLFELFGPAETKLVERFGEREKAGVFSTRGLIEDAGVERTVGEPSDGPTDVVFDGGVLSETFGDDRRHLLLFGAGHVGRAVVMALAPLPFTITWLDSRRDAFPSHYPANVSIKLLEDPARSVAAAPQDGFALVMTHSHQLDLNIVQALLNDSRFGYVGLIGSPTKKARFVKRLAAGGVSADRINDLVCPIGLRGIRSKAPAIIAAATAAEILERDEALRAQRHASETTNIRRHMG